MHRLAPRAMLLTLLLPAVAALLAPTPVAAATNHVKNCNNSGPDSLPAVVAGATANDTVIFDQNCTGANAITLTSDTGAITIAMNLTIDATVGSHAVTVDSGNAVRVFMVNGGVTATLNGLTIQHGSAFLGGGINNGGTLTVIHSTIADNIATPNGLGGGIYSGPGATLTVMDSTISGNTAAVGAGIVNSGDMLTVTGSTISGNHATSGGGGIDNGGTLIMTKTTLTNNGASTGGGINNSGGATVTNSTFASNTANSGGGIDNNINATLTVTNSTLSGNTVTFPSGGQGGGIWITGGTATLANTLVAGNTTTGSGPDVYGPASSGGHNLIGSTDSSTGWRTSDLQNVAANLGPLANNGGPTQTFAVLTGSPAIGAGDPVICQQSGTGKVNGIDQRGQPRLASTCDIGAYQLQGTQLVAGGGSSKAGVTMPLAIILFDGYGNLLTAYTGTVHFSCSDPLATLPADYTFTGSGSGHDNGIHATTAIFRTAGTQTVTITDTLAGTLAAQTTIAVTPVVSAVSPSSGGTAGNNHVSLAGLGFGTVPANVAVTIGGSPATVDVVTNTGLTVIAPAHPAGTVNMVVQVNGQGTTVTNGYTYGTVSPLPGSQPPGGMTGNPGTLPQSRPTGSTTGNPSPLPPSRP